MNLNLGTIENFLEKNLTKILTYTITIEILILGFAATRHIFSPDEIEFLQSAWFTAQGKSPYTDFFDNHHPLIFYLLAPFFSFFKDPLHACFVGRTLSYLAVLGIMLATFRIGATLYNKNVGLLACALIPSWAMATTTLFEVRADIFQVCCGTWSIYFLIKALHEKNSRLLFLTGIFFGLTFLFLQKGFFIGLIILSVLILEIFFTHLSSSCLISFFAGTLVITVPYYGYLFVQNRLEDYWRCCYFFNQSHFDSQSIIKLLNPKRLTRFLFIEGFMRDRIQWTLCALGITTITNYLKVAPLIMGTCFGVFWATVCSCGPQYHLWYVPFGSLLAGLGFAHLFKKEHVATILFFYAALFPVTTHLSCIFNDLKSNKEQLAETRRCQKLLNPDDYVTTANYALLFHEQTHPLWYLYDILKGHYQKTVKNEPYSWSQGIEKHNPVFISKEALYNNLNESEFFKKNYVLSKKFSSFYIRKDRINTECLNI